ncbi:MAG TPA: alpha/beta hydrolase [Nitrolancea sp.]|jgi:fermentation-respiration switch protein FrsA (DUF1100 family)|nr:alpha/beta hydrolase [Nitrolancea sp.]
MILLVFLLPVAVVLVGVGWYASGRAIHPKQNAYDWTLRDYPALKSTIVRFKTCDGFTLAGRFFPGASRSTIILSHGYGDNQDQMLPWADFLHAAGFSIFTYDMRSRGGSGGDAVTLGAREQHDLVAAVDYLATRPDVDRERIGALGVSLGGSVSILAAAQDARIAALVDDSGFSDAANVVSTSFQTFLHIPAFPFAPLTIRFAQWRMGANMNDVRPVAHIGTISPRPILIIHGLSDSAVPPDNSERNYAAAGEPKEIWWVPDADHVRAFEVDPDEYKRRVTGFFVKSLGL